MPPIITLTTDFGTADGYVAEMKAVLLSRVSDAVIVDVTHDIAPQDVERARLTLARIWRQFPAGTVHVVVVDPGVGSSRRALAVNSAGRFLVGPDNGVLSAALLTPPVRAVALPVPPNASATFHGRDVFAPAAAALAAGERIGALGEDVFDSLIRRTPEPRPRPDGSIEGEILVIDHFGNAITNLTAPHGGTVEIDGRTLPIRVTYSAAAAGEPLALVGSSGFVEISVRAGDASAQLDLSRGQKVGFRAG